MWILCENIIFFECGYPLFEHPSLKNQSSKEAQRNGPQRVLSKLLEHSYEGPHHQVIAFVIYS
jgi:hypothetical protein